MPETRDVRRRIRWRLLERLTGWALLRMAKLAARDGDTHELNHVVAQVSVGNTSDCPAECVMRSRPARITFEHRGEETR